MGRNEPWFEGALVLLVSASRSRERMAQKHATLVEPSRARVEEGIAQAERGELGDGEEAVARVKKRAAAKRRRSRE